VNSVTQYADFTKVSYSFKMSYVFAIQANSRFAIAERSEPTNHHDISNNIHSACAFRVAGTANSDLWFSSIFWCCTWKEDRENWL